MDSTSPPGRLADGAHHQDGEQLLAQLDSGPQGLSQAEAEARQAHWGANQLQANPPLPAWRRWLRQFHNLFIYVLMASALLSLALGHGVDAGVILAVILINASIGFLQEGKAEAALQAIMSLSHNRCLVRRGGQALAIDSRELVPGDLVLLQAGDRVPADLRLLHSRELSCDESMLTGESLPSHKHPAPVAQATPLAERRSMAFMGTLVSRGAGTGLVVGTAANTQIGSINQLVQQLSGQRTPLQAQLGRLTQQLSLAILLATLAVILLSLGLHSLPLNELLQGAVGIAVSAIPEGLPAIVTIALALGVERMASKHALVRRLPAVEVLGSVDVICTDKTGTLTANAMTVRQLVTSRHQYRVSGEGYSPEGEFQHQASDELDLATPDAGDDSCLQLACRIALLCNDANITHQDGHWQLHGDPTEGALFALALKAGFNAHQASSDWPRLDTLPFESERRYMASLHGGSDGAIPLREMAVKGAPDRLLPLCQLQWGSQGPEPINHRYWEAQLAQLADQGMRVLALAYRPLEPHHQQLEHQHLEQGLVMVALAGISDPPRREAITAIARCQSAGIRVVMITGDNPATAAAIGRELGLHSQAVMTGAQLDKLSPAQLADAAERVDIFARTSPANKLQLVEALQARQHTVAMTGDGVNDAPALRRADIGIAMGMKGTDAAREAGAFVLTDDNFATIARAVAEGRTIYDNILKSLVFILPTNIMQASIIALALVFGWLLPITPAQVLWVNTVTAISLALALVFERGEANIMERPPRPRHSNLLNRTLVYRLLLVAGLGTASVFALFSWQLQQGASLELARAIAVNSLVLIQCFYLLGARSFHDAIWHPGYWLGIAPSLVAIALVLMLQMAFTYLPLSQHLFGLAPLALHHWLLVALASCPLLVLVELEKTWRRHRQGAAP